MSKKPTAKELKHIFDNVEATTFYMSFSQANKSKALATANFFELSVAEPLNAVKAVFRGFAAGYAAAVGVSFGSMGSYKKVTMSEPVRMKDFLGAKLKVTSRGLAALCGYSYARTEIRCVNGRTKKRSTATLVDKGFYCSIFSDNYTIGEINPQNGGLGAGITDPLVEPGALAEALPAEAPAADLGPP